ncbi:hypothetical protein HDV05_007050 [Chytridiales sp. JEL 0842]|nr:hypothetical protein HDV05_007050 [Chytridiales sp. JEL 0842]
MIRGKRLLPLAVLGTAGLGVWSYIILGATQSNKGHAPIVRGVMYEIRQDQRAKELLGTNITIPDDAKFKGDVNHFKGFANLEFKIKGDKGEAMLKMDSRRISEHDWDVRVLDIRKDGKTLSLA